MHSNVSKTVCLTAFVKYYISAAASKAPLKFQIKIALALEESLSKRKYLAYLAISGIIPFCVFRKKIPAECPLMAVMWLSIGKLKRLAPQIACQ